ncbi:MAG TPA: SpoIIE family protein phosphatase [Thermoanaerobaculia bacterium]|nr:SpoIIE family protein phosphatase [Thermoanaerobaculia bacterium]
MSPARRIAIGLTFTVIFLAAAAAWTIGVLRTWDARGWTGAIFIRSTSSRAPKLGAGRVLMSSANSPALRAGIRAGDRVVAIDGISITNSDGLDELDARAKTGDVLRYRMERDRATFDVPITLASPVRERRFLIEAAATVGIAACFLLVGLVIFLRRADDMRAVVFYAMVVASVMSLMVSIGAAGATGEARGIAFKAADNILPEVMVLLCSLSFLPITLHLSLIFPHERPILKRRPNLIRWIYAGPAFVAVLGVAMMYCAWTPKGPSWFLDRATITMLLAGVIAAIWMAPKIRAEGFRKAVARRPYAALFVPASLDFAIFDAISHRLPTVATVILGIAFFLPATAIPVFPIAACVSLARSYREASLEEKRQVRWPLWGTFTAIVTKIVCTAIAIVWTFWIAFHPLRFDSSWASAVTIIPRVTSLLIPLSFAAAILKYRLMNIDIIIKKTVVYAMLSGLLIASYLFMVGGLGSLLVRIAGVQDQTIVVASTLILALLFVPVRNRLQQLIDRNFFRQRYDYPQALRTISGETLTATDLGAFLQFVAEALQQALQTRGIAIFIRRQNDFVATAKVGFPDSILGSLRINTASELTGMLDRPFAPHRRHVAEEEAAVLRRVDAKLVVPVRTAASVQGFVALAGKLSDREFDLDDIDFLSSAADQIAMTAERIRLQREEVEFEQARDMQRTLLPRELPRVPGIDVVGTWEPARTVGGDYYDCLDLGDGSLAVCIGDVAGKGMPAALLMASLQAAVRASAEAKVSPAALCERVRRVVVSSLTGGRFVTFFFCIVDPKSRTIRYCNAGHNPPVLVRTDGSVQQLEGGGPVFSRLFREAYGEGSVPLEAGDRVVLFTDGVTEARNAAGEDLGDDGLVQLIVNNRHRTAGELQHAVVDAVSAYSRGRFEDDVTMVVVGVA